MLGAKKIENRTWDTKFRGDFLIHAGKNYDFNGHQWVAYHFPDLRLPPAMSLPMGGIVGKATLVDVVREHDSPWFFGPYGFVMQNVEPSPFRAVNGQLSFFEVRA
jgi:hypothetical protein